MFRNSGYLFIRLTFPLLAVIPGGSAASQEAAPATSGSAASQEAAPATTAVAQADAFDQHLAAARESAGAEWVSVIDYMCTRGPVTPNRPDHPLIEPVQIFDNVYAIGRNSTVVYVIETSEGLILIDSGYGDQVDSVLLPGMAQLGLDPQDIEYVFVLHGHGDHYGGSTHLQERFGARVVASETDWDLMEGIIPSRRGSTVPAPSRDVIAVDGEPIGLGDVTVTPYLVPGHTPGAIGVVFPVRDGENTHRGGRVRRHGAERAIPRRCAAAIPGLRRSVWRHRPGGGRQRGTAESSHVRRHARKARATAGKACGRAAPVRARRTGDVSTLPDDGIPVHPGAEGGCGQRRGMSARRGRWNER